MVDGFKPGMSTYKLRGVHFLTSDDRYNMVRGSNSKVQLKISRENSGRSGEHGHSETELCKLNRNRTYKRSHIRKKNWSETDRKLNDKIRLIDNFTCIGDDITDLISMRMQINMISE